MKIKSLVQILTAFGLAIGAILRVSPPSYAEPTTFFCETYENVPATMAHTSRGEIPIIIWVTHYFSNSGFSGLSLQRRCIDVAKRFQNYYNKGTLNYLTTGIMNGQPVVCVAEIIGGSCTGLLFTLRPGSDPSRILQRLLDMAVGNSDIGNTAPLYLTNTGQPDLSPMTVRVYINMNEYLNRGLAEEELYEGDFHTYPDIIKAPICSDASDENEGIVCPRTLW